MKKLSKILIIIAIIILAGVSYYAYTQYNTLKTQEYIKTSKELKDNDTSYLNQAAGLEKSGDYSGAIIAYQKSKEYTTNAINENNQALKYASGVYKEYLDNDSLLLDKTAKLIEYKIYVNQYYNNSLNSGQEKVNPSVLSPYIDNLEKEIASYKSNENNIINNNPEAFKFLNQ